MITSRIDDQGKVNSEHIQDLYFSSVNNNSSKCFVYWIWDLGYKKAIAENAEDVSAKYEKFIENMKEIYPERAQILEEYLE